MQNHPQTFPDSPVSFTMIAIEGNRQGYSFKMSDTYQVRLNDFWMGEYPVTQALWANVMNDTDITDPSYFEGANRPVESVSWEDIDQLFLPRLNEKTKENRSEGTIYRLPTKAEWEYAARGGKYWQKYPFEYAGSNKLEDVGWYNDNSHSETKAVGLKNSNLLGLYDMSGNVWEWCSNNWHGSYPDPSKSVAVNPIGSPTGARRVNCGGSWGDYARLCRSMNHSNTYPGLRNYFVGFRLVLSSSVQ